MHPAPAPQMFYYDQSALFGGLGGGQHTPVNTGLPTLMFSHHMSIFLCGEKNPPWSKEEIDNMPKDKIAYSSVQQRYIQTNGGKVQLTASKTLHIYV